MPNEELSVRVIRSTKRTKSLSARRIGNVIEVTVPARLRSDQVAQAVEELVAAVKERTAPPSDTQLAERARVPRSGADGSGGIVAQSRYLGVG